MTYCRVGSLTHCGVGIGNHRHEVQYKCGDDWIIYGYTKSDSGWPLKDELEATGKEVRVIDTKKPIGG